MSVETFSIATVDRQKCSQMATLLSAINLPKDRESITLTSLSNVAQGNFYLFLVAICHQTSPRNKPPLDGEINGEYMRGWDFLLHRFLEVVQGRIEYLQPRNWIRISSEQVRDLFGPALSDPHGRAALLRDLGEFMERRQFENLHDILAYCGFRIGEDDPNIVDILAETRAYADPVHKKTYYLLSILQNSGLAQFVDPNNLLAPVDYHEVRGHLRIGTVQIHDAELADKLANSREVTCAEDIAIRTAVRDAIAAIRSELRDISNSQLHYLFWNVFRSICLRKYPRCYDVTGLLLSTGYENLIRIGKCPFVNVCASAGRSHPVCEHVFATDYY